MKSDDEMTIYIVNESKLMQTCNDALSYGAIGMMPILVGVLLQSAAMQWVGFLFTILFVFALAARSKNRTTFTSIEEAVRYLEEQDGK